MTVGYRGKQSTDTGAYYAPYAPSGMFPRDYKYLSSDVVDNVVWHRIRTYTVETTDWIKTQDSTHWYLEDGYSQDFWVREELYTIFMLRWS